MSHSMMNQNTPTEVFIDPQSVLIENTLANQKRKFVYLASAPPIENVVFSGGGAKGAVYPGVIKALENQGIRNVAGSSIGAITAALFAAGITGDAFKSITLEENFKELLGSFNAKLQKTGDPILNFVRHQLSISIVTAFSSVDKQAFIARYNQLSETDKVMMHQLFGDAKQEKEMASLFDSLPALIQSLKEQKDTYTTPVTFSMLNRLQQFNGLAGIDGKFKSLAVTSLNKNNGELYVFNHEHTPDLEIALACRASASLPVILAPVPIPKEVLGKYATQGDGVFVDGGMIDNIPTSLVDSRQTKERGVNLGEQGQNLQTMVFLFDETRKTPYAPLPNPAISPTPTPIPEQYQSPYLSYTEFDDHDLYTPKLFERIYRNLMPKILGGVKTSLSNTAAKARGLKQVASDFGQRNVPLFVAGIGSTSFDQAQNQAPDLIDQSEAQTRTYLENHKDEAISLSSDDPVSLLLMIPLNKLHQLITDNKNVYGLSVAELEKIKNFRLKTTDFLAHISDANILKDLSLYVHRELKLIGTSPEPYYDYLIDQLHSDKKRWNLILKQLPNAYALEDNLYKAIFKKDAQDQLIDKQRELLRFLNQEIVKLNTQNKTANLTLLETTKDKVRLATSFADLSSAMSPLAEQYREQPSKLTMLSLLKKPATISQAEAKIKALSELSLQYDAYLPWLNQTVKPQEEIKETSTNFVLTAEPEKQPPIADPLAETISSQEAQIKKPVAFIELASLADENAAQEIMEQLQEKGINKLFLAAPIGPQSPIKSPEIIKTLQAHGFDLTVILPMDSMSDEISIGSTYQQGIQANDDLGYIQLPEIKAKVDITALNRAHDTVGYLSLMNQLKSEDLSINDLMQQKFISQISRNVSSVVYIGTTAQPLVGRVTELGIAFHSIHTDSPHSIETQFNALTMPELSTEARVAAKKAFAENKTWQAQFEKLIEKIHLYESQSTNQTQQEQMRSLLRIEQMHGNYKEKTELLYKANDHLLAHNKVQEIQSPLEDIRKELDLFITKYNTGLRRVYYSALNKLNIQTLGSKKMDFALRYRDHVDTVLAHAGPNKKNAQELQKASQLFVGYFKRDYEQIYQGNEQDKQNPRCKFRECIKKIKEPMETLEESVRPGFRR